MSRNLKNNPTEALESCRQRASTPFQIRKQMCLQTNDLRVKWQVHWATHSVPNLDLLSRISDGWFEILEPEEKQESREMCRMTPMSHWWQQEKVMRPWNSYKGLNNTQLSSDLRGDVLFSDFLKCRMAQASWAAFWWGGVQQWLIHIS